MAFVIEPPEQVALPVEDSVARFPVHRVYCVGRNYAAHTVEMGGDPDRDPPFFFQKNPGCFVTGGAAFPYPPRTSDVHHEIELAVALGRGGETIAVEDAMDHVWGYAVALDMTRRDLQAECKRLGRPWEVAKAFEHSAPIGTLVDAAGRDVTRGAITLDVNGERRQTGDLDQMIWKVPEIVSYLSGLFVLRPGDVILTGTPSGVGAVERGDVLEGRIEGIGTLTAKVA